MKIQKFNPITWLAALASLICASALSAQVTNLTEDESFFYEDVSPANDVFDPLEAINRYTFQFNDFVYLKVFDPLVAGYTAITPDPVERGASNFFQNLRYPVRLAGNLLQGRLKGAWVETGRFAINSTVGLAGILRPADTMEAFAPIKPEDVGQALASWGIGEGPYLVLPLLGPSNLRDLGGLVGDRAVNPLKEPYSVISHWNWEWQLALTGTELIARSPSMMEQYKSFKGTAIDPYSSMRNGYTQFRRGAVEE